MLKLLFYTFILSKSYIVMKCSIKLVAYWLIFFGDRTCKYRHDNYQAIFHIFRLISNFPLKQLSPSHSHKKDVIIKFENNFFFKKTGNCMQTSWSPYRIFGTVYCSLQQVLRAKSKTKATLKHSTLKRAMSNPFRKALL